MNWESIIRQPLVPGIAMVMLLARLATRGLSWSGVVILGIVLLWFALALIDWLVHWQGRRRQAQETVRRAVEEFEAPLSLVMLLAEPRRIDRDSVSECVRDALGELESIEEIRVEDGNASPAVDSAGEPTARQFLVSLPVGVFGILASSRPYLSEPGAFARGAIRDKRLRTAVEGHRAWLSVDLVSAAPEEPEARHRAYGIIGRLLASMAGPDCLAIYAPEIRRCNEFDPSLIERLRSGVPLSIFDEPTFEPVIEIEENHPRMLAAVEEALSRWPEFATAFHQRATPDDDRFIVKAEFVEGQRSEFMWVAVTRLEGGLINGILMNDPHELESLYRGKSVSVEIDRLNDWLYPGGDGEVVGGFTLKVLSEDAEARRRRGRKAADVDEDDDDDDQEVDGDGEERDAGT